LFHHLLNRREGYLMKKSLSLLAIVGLLFSMGLVSQVLANAPVYPEVPSVKLFTNNVGLTPAFDLAYYNTAPAGFNGDKATSYSITANFLSNIAQSSSSFSNLASVINVGGYSSATDGSNTFSVANAGGSATPSDKVKYATYNQHEYGKYGLSVGASVTVAVSSYTAGNVAAAAPSFGNPAAIVVSDTTKVTAVWNASSSAVIITLTAGTSSPVYVDVIAAPVIPAGTDQDKERIAIYTNNFGVGSFATGADTAGWGLQAAPGKTTQAGQNLLAADSDSANVAASGVWQFTFADVNGGVKATPFSGNYVSVTQGKWYISRMRIADKTASNADQALLFSFGNTAAAGVTADISADVYSGSGIPTVWTWMEAPVYIHGPTGVTAYPQFQLKAGAAGSVDIDEIQFIQATPKILDGTRKSPRSFISGGLFTSGAATTQWGSQGYFNAAAVGSVTPLPPFTLTSDTAIGSALSANFSGAGSGASQIGFKWTYGNGTLITPAITVGRQYGATAQITSTLPTGASELSQVLVAAFGVGTNGAASPLNRIEAAAIVGVIVNGTISTVGTASDGFTQVQFGARADASGVLNVANVDVISDSNDPNYGDVALFP
jgi:hypothetical protein